MALIITPGPVPADSSRIAVEEVMTAFIQGTSITNFGPDEFEGEPVDFITSSTDPPATSSRGRGTVWFARGTGRLYKWAIEPVQSEFFAPSEAGSNTGSEGHWVAISDRREMLVTARWNVGANERVNISAATSEWRYEISKDISGEPRYTPIVASTAGTDGAAEGGFGFNNAVFLGMHHFVDPFYVAESGIVSAEYGVVVDCGYADVKIQGPGCNGPGGRPQLAMHRQDGDPHYALSSENSSAMTTTSAVLGAVCQSAPSNAEQVLLTLLHATSTNFVKASNESFFNG